MNQFPSYWLLAKPDFNSPVGGIKQIHRLAEALNVLGRSATLIQDSKDFHPNWFSSSVQTISFECFESLTTLSPSNHILVIPELCLADIETWHPRLPKIILNQNGAYTFGIKGDNLSIQNPEHLINLYEKDSMLQVMCVSDHDYRLLKYGLCLPAQKLHRLVNPIEKELFCVRGRKKRQLAFMPRKRSRDASIVLSLLQRQEWFRGWSLVAIANMSQAQVASTFQQSVGFLSFGYPEGFGLPLAEAAACGCALLGYDGLGGTELMNLAVQHGVGWSVPFGDWLGFVRAVHDLQLNLDQSPNNLAERLQALSNEMRATYSMEAFVNSLRPALSRIEAQLLSR